MTAPRVAADIPTGGQFAASERGEADLPLTARPVLEMPAAEFVATFPPSLYSGSWDTIDDSETEYDDPEDPDGEYDPRFCAGGDQCWDMDELADSLYAEGMREPVEVLEGRVTEGCHRVVAALRVGAVIRYVEL